MMAHRRAEKCIEIRLRCRVYAQIGTDLRSTVSIFCSIYYLLYIGFTSLSSAVPALLDPRRKMPYVDLHCDDDYASIFYMTNAPRRNVGGFDAAKPSIIILHPLFLDSSWLDEQFEDPRLTSHYNLIAFDMRTCGKSTCRPSGRHDSWVEAADLAFCHQVCNITYE